MAVANFRSLRLVGIIIENGGELFYSSKPSSVFGIDVEVVSDVLFSRETNIVKADFTSGIRVTYFIRVWVAYAPTPPVINVRRGFVLLYAQ